MISTTNLDYVATDISDFDADYLIESLQKKFTERKIARIILANKDYEKLLVLRPKELQFCIQYLGQMNEQTRINVLTNLVDYFSDAELKHMNLKVIFSNFKEELRSIA